MRHLIPMFFPPCRQTMGPCSSSSARRARRLQNCPGGLSDMCVYLYCCTASACKADGVEIVHVYEAYREQRDADRKDCKERARLIAEILIQLQLRKRVTPRSCCGYHGTMSLRSARPHAAAHDRREQGKVWGDVEKNRGGIRRDFGY